MAKPDMVILYTDPVAKMPSRLCYSAPDAETHRHTIEHRGVDGMGEDRWAPPVGAHLLAWAIFGYVLRQVALDKIKPIVIEGVVTVDARAVTIPAPQAAVG